MSVVTQVGRHWDVLREAWALERERRRTAPKWRETDFLPAALEVVETPPNPLGKWMLWTLMALVAFAVLWSVLAKVDIVAIAPAKTVADGRNKLVQSAEGGVVREIFVRDGQQVKLGQPLVALDPTATGAELSQAQSALQAARLTVARNRALLGIYSGADAVFRPPADTPTAVVAVERQLIVQRSAELDAKVATLASQAEEARAQIAGASAEQTRLTGTLPMLSDRVARRRSLADKGLSSKILQLELEQQELDHRGQIAVQAATAHRARAALVGVGRQAAMARAEAAREVLTDLSRAEAEVQQREEEVNKAQNRSGLQMLRAPADGTVQQLAVYAAGAVLKPADPILVVVPANTPLIVEAQVLNRDVGFVRIGQRVTVKFDAYPFTRYGVTEGRLVGLSRDAVVDDKLGPVYQARVRLLASSLTIEGQRQPLAPGLGATAEISTGSRRVIDFLLSPLERRLGEAGRER